MGGEIVQQQGEPQQRRRIEFGLPSQMPPPCSLFANHTPAMSDRAKYVVNDPRTRYRYGSCTLEGGHTLHTCTRDNPLICEQQTRLRFVSFHYTFRAMWSKNKENYFPWFSRGLLIAPRDAASRSGRLGARRSPVVRRAQQLRARPTMGVNTRVPPSKDGTDAATSTASP